MQVGQGCMGGWASVGRGAAALGDFYSLRIYVKEVFMQRESISRLSTIDIYIE